METRVTKVEAEQIARFVVEQHGKLSHGLVIDRYSNGRLRLTPAKT